MAIERYETLELRFSSGEPASYRLEVTASPQGEQPTPEAVEIPASDIVFPQPGDDLQTLGARLGRWLFPPPAEALYRAALAALPSDAGLRLRLRLDPPELAALPWELAHDPVRGAFPALSRRTPLVRYQALPFRAAPLGSPSPLRVLFAASAPKNLMPLDSAAEKARLVAALADLQREGRVAVDVLEGRATVEALQDALRGGGPHVFHFSGHGRAGALALERTDGAIHWVGAAGLALLLADSGVRLALLNACETGAQPGGPFVGVAPSLVRAGLPAVVAMQAPMPDGSAVCFCRNFYAALAGGLPVDVAVVEGRKAVALEAGLTRPDWAIPVFYLRAPDGRLWSLEDEEVAEAEAPDAAKEGDIYDKITVSGGVIGAIGGRGHRIEQRIIQDDEVQDNEAVAEDRDS